MCTYCSCKAGSGQKIPDSAKKDPGCKAIKVSRSPLQIPQFIFNRENRTHRGILFLFQPVLYIRIRIGTVFRRFLDPYSEYGSGSTHVNIRLNGGKR